MQRFLSGVLEAVLNGDGWKKLLNPTVARGWTAWPTGSNDQERHGVRYDYDGEIEIGGVIYSKFQMQANAGNKIPSTIKRWRGAKGGTHAVMADVFVPKDGNKQDVMDALTKAHKEVKGVSIVLLSMYTSFAQMPFVDYVEYVLVSRLSLHRFECKLRVEVVK